MKLSTKTNTYHLLFLIVLAPVMIAADYFLIRHVVNEEVNEILEHESERILFHLQKGSEIPNSNYLFEVTPLRKNAPSLNQFTDTLIYEAYAERLIPYRTYQFSADVDGEKLSISLRHVLLAMNELILWLFAVTTIILILLAAGLFYINHRISKWAWKPFHRNLSKLRNYDISKKNPVHLEASGVSEFEALNQVIATLMNQVEKDFQNLKEFNENISHEMQTPLAIIRNKMVLLLESQHLDQKELNWVQAAYQEVNKLSKIGKSLTLISRIENEEFSQVDSVDVRATIDNIISNMEEIIQFKSLEVTAKLDPVKVKCDPILANILFTNLIKNAIQHNWNGGSIRMQLDEEKFEIENTGEVLEAETGQLFKRFHKGNTATDTLGLGLAINQKICELYGFQLDYEHQQGEHRFCLSFSG